MARLILLTMLNLILVSYVTTNNSRSTRSDPAAGKVSATELNAVKQMVLDNHSTMTAKSNKLYADLKAKFSTLTSADLDSFAEEYEKLKAASAPILAKVNAITSRLYAYGMEGATQCNFYAGYTITDPPNMEEIERRMDNQASCIATLGDAVLEAASGMHANKIDQRIYGGLVEIQMSYDRINKALKGVGDAVKALDSVVHQ